MTMKQNLHQDKIDQLIGLLESDVGYSGQSGVVEREYSFVTGDGQKWTADAIAFGDSNRQDISTSCIAIHWADSKEAESTTLDSLRYVGVPVALIVSSDGVKFTNVPTDVVNNETPRSENWSFDNLRNNLLHHKRELKPEFLLKAKRTGQQMSFFAIDPSLEIFARQATQKALVDQFTSAIASVADTVQEKHPAEVTKLAIWVLAARILQDKLVNNVDLQTRNALELLRSVQRKHESYFDDLDRVLDVVGHGTLETLYTGLLGEFTFRSLTNDMLAYFYENTLVDDNLKQSLGIFYTPRHLTERILKRLPVEDLPPEKRTVLDGSSGSGNFLLSAYDRLENLLPVQWTLAAKHDYLLQHLLGMDIDGFATEVAKLALLHYDLPAGNSWQIKKGDFLDEKFKGLFNRTAHIIVTNPPFRKESKVKREQLASVILQKYLNILPEGGLLGIVVPLTILDAAHSKGVRRKLLAEYRIFEVWHLFQGVVPTWSSDTAVILAQKLSAHKSDTETHLTRINEIIGTDKVSFEQLSIPTSSYIVSQSSWMEDTQYRMTSSPIDSILDKLNRECKQINTVATILGGVAPGKIARKTHFSPTRTNEHNRKVLYRNYDANLEPYRIDWHSQDIKYIKHPGQLKRPGEQSYLDKKQKVILNGARSAGGRWRLYAAVDVDQLIPSENFHYGFPTDNEVSCQQIAAVLNSPVANAWYVSKSGDRNVAIRLLNKLPFPTFTEYQGQKIDLLVDNLSKIKRGERSSSDLDKARKIINEIDQIVFDAYGLTIDQQNAITDWFMVSPRPRPGLEWRQAGGWTPSKITHGTFIGQTDIRHKRMISGMVLSLNPAENRMRIEVNGIEYSITIPNNAPGWMLTEDVLFDATVTGEFSINDMPHSIIWLDFEPIGYGYLSDDSLMEFINHAFSN